LDSLLTVGDNTLIKQTDKDIILNNYNLHVQFVMNPIGYEIDGSNVKFINGEKQNVSGIYYRKNGNLTAYTSQQQKEFFDHVAKLKETVLANCAKNVHDKSNDITSKTQILYTHNYGIDLNRNSGFTQGNIKLWDYFKYNNIPIRDIQSHYSLTVEEVITVDAVKRDLRTKTNILDNVYNNGLWNAGNELVQEYSLTHTYRGLKPNSEVEIRSFQDYFMKHNFDCFISTHTPGNTLLPPKSFDPKLNYLIPFFNKQRVEYDAFIKTVSNDTSGLVAITNLTLPQIQQTNTRDIRMFYSTVNDAIGYTVNGCMTGWTQIYKQSVDNNTQYETFTIESGSKTDFFYPSKYEMIDLIHTSVNTIVAVIKRTWRNVYCVEISELTKLNSLISYGEP
jgi:hypothetical protein